MVNLLFFPFIAAVQVTIAMTVEDFGVEATGEEIQTKNANEGRIIPSSELLDEFASYTTLHGFHFVLGSVNCFRRIVWAVLVILGMGTLILQCFNGFTKLSDKDSITVKEQQRSKTIPFPAVTICNQNMLRKDKILGTEAQKFLDDVESFMFNEGLRENGTHWQNFTLDLDRVVKAAGHNISEMLLLCYWHGRLCGPDDFYMSITRQVSFLVSPA